MKECLSIMLVAGLDGKERCFGNKQGQQRYAIYHDTEWGVPVHDDTLLFEMLILEGAQAGLSWEIILNKRLGYRQAFHQFDVPRVATMSDAELEALRHNPNIVRNRLKIAATRQNARVWLDIQARFGSFDAYVWGFVQHQPIINHWKTHQDVPTHTTQSGVLAKDLKARGMRFVGGTIMYAYMQGVGMVNDHLTECWRYGH